MRFNTRNSVYEVDRSKKLWRRVKGLNDPLESQGTDGEWKPYEFIVGPNVGSSCIIAYMGGVRGFETSTVLSVEPDLVEPAAKDTPCASQQQSPVMMA